MEKNEKIVIALAAAVAVSSVALSVTARMKTNKLKNTLQKAADRFHAENPDFPNA
jgi:hypothetical protein